MKKLSLTLILSFSLLHAFSCLNKATNIMLTGERLEEPDDYCPRGTDFEPLNNEYERDLDTLLKLWNNTHNPIYYSDYGLALVYLGRYEEAKKVFISIEKKHPGKYYTAANLGTTYELLGKNDSALIWIKKAVEIDPLSHDASEWLHVKILEAKIGGDRYINSDFLIGTSFGDGEDPVSNLDSMKLVALRDAIYYQLNERVSFIKPKDKIVALLLFELGNLCVLTADVTNAMYNYELATEYGYSSEVMKNRFNRYYKMQDGLANKYGGVLSDEEEEEEEEEAEERNQLLIILICVTAGAVLLFIGILWYRKRRKRKG